MAQNWTAHQTAIEECLRATLAVQADTHAEFLYEADGEEDAVSFDSTGPGVWPLHVVIHNDQELDRDGDAQPESRRYRVRVVLELVTGGG